MFWQRVTPLPSQMFLELGPWNLQRTQLQLVCCLSQPLYKSSTDPTYLLCNYNSAHWTSTISVSHLTPVVALPAVIGPWIDMFSTKYKSVTSSQVTQAICLLPSCYPFSTSLNSIKKSLSSLYLFQSNIRAPQRCKKLTFWTLSLSLSPDCAKPTVLTKTSMCCVEKVFTEVSMLTSKPQPVLTVW